MGGVADTHKLQGSWEEKCGDWTDNGTVATSPTACSPTWHVCSSTRHKGCPQKGSSNCGAKAALENMATHVKHIQITASAPMQPSYPAPQSWRATPMTPVGLHGGITSSAQLPPGTVFGVVTFIWFAHAPLCLGYWQPAGGGWVGGCGGGWRWGWGGELGLIGPSAHCSRHPLMVP